MRRFLNSKLTTCTKALLPLREIKNELAEKIGNRRFCLARYGQKADLSESMKKLLEEISEKFESYAAVAVELNQDGAYLSAASVGYKLESCFPFLFSPLATNLELKKSDSSTKVAGSYR